MASKSEAASGSAVELEFELRGDGCFFVDASAATGADVTLERLVRRSDGGHIEFFAVDGAPVERVLSMATEASAIDRARLVDPGIDGGLFEFVVSGPCVTTTLADTGAVAQSVSARAGVGRVVAAVPGHVDVRPVVERFRERHEGADLVARRSREHSLPVRTPAVARATLRGSLTDRQLTVLREAHRLGYFERPRGSTAAECADALGIAQSTFSQHIRTAQRKVFDALFGGDHEREP